MKFRDGHWQVRPGITPFYAVHVHEVETQPDALVVYAPTRQLTNRADTFNTPLITVRYSSPLENVIRVQIEHFKGGLPRNPSFCLRMHPTPAVTVRDEPAFASLTTGRLTVRVDKGNTWRVDFLDGEKAVTHSGKNGMGFADTPDGRFIFEQLGLGVGEYVYGLGERFTHFVKNGQVVDLWNEDGGTDSEQTYKNIPFYLTNRGYGVFVNHPEKVSYEVASEHVERVQFSLPGESLDYFLIYGPDPKDVLTRYTALTGRPALPPAWSFGLWLTTSFITSYDEDTVNSFVDGMAQRDIPLHVFHFDCFWMKEFRWVDLRWDERVFPDPQGMLQRLKAKGLRICVWINPYIAQRSYLFEEGKRNGYLVKKPDGAVWQWDHWQAGMGLVDFTNPAACRWYADKLMELVDMGVDCFKTDFGERIPTDVVYFDGSDPFKMHNYYTYLYNQTVFKALEARLGSGAAAVFARSATAGSQQFPVHWGGDSTATFESMAETLRGGLSLSMSGFSFWSHDIGGFENTARAEVYKRWCAFGLLSSHSRLHGSSSYRVPWLFDEEAVEVLRFFTRLKCRLMPYLFAAACEAHESGVPVMRAMALEFPDDPGCDTLERQYMLGRSFLVAPVFNAAGEVDYYLPAGRWTHFLTGAVVEGGRWVREQHGFLSLPLLARPNSLIAVGAIDDRPDYAYAEGVTFHLFELEEGRQAVCCVPDVSGAGVFYAQASRTGQVIMLHVEGMNERGWSLLLRGVHEALSIDGGSAVRSDLGLMIQPAPGAKTITVRLG